jgi:hypothetical protein
MNKLVLKCKTITKINEESQKKNLRFFTKLTEEKQLEILERQRQIFRDLKRNGKYKEVSNQLITLASLIQAIDECKKKMNDVKINSIKYRAKKTKTEQKKEKLLQYWSIVVQLKEDEDYSFRAISEYLYKYHRFEVSHSTINNCWNQIETEKNEDKK